MNRSPDRLNLDHLKKQAKDLIRLYRSRDAAAMARFRAALPAAAGHSDEDISSLELRLHDAQSCIAREHGFGSWPDLKRYVEVQMAARSERCGARPALGAAPSIPAMSAARPTAPTRALRCGCWRMIPQSLLTIPGLPARSATKRALRQATQADPSWVNRNGGPLRLPPLFAVAHSSLLRVAGFASACIDARSCSSRLAPTSTSTFSAAGSRDR